MDFCIETSDLQKAIRLLSVTAKVNVKDFTGKVLISADENGFVKFLSTNGATALAFVSDKAQINSPGTAIIEYGKVKTLISTFKSWDNESGVKDFHFHSDNTKLQIDLTNIHETGKTTKGKLKIPTFESRVDREPTAFTKADFTLNSNIFRKATSKILYALDPSDARQFIQGMNISFNEEDIVFVGTNGLVLSEYRIKNICDRKEGSVLMRYDFIMGLRRALSDETNINFQFTDRDVIAAFDNVIFWGKPVIGHDYPTYESILQSFEHTLMLDKEILMSNLLPFADILDPEDYYRLTFNIENGLLTFSNYLAKFEYEDKVDFDGKFTIDINGRNMIQTIENIKDDRIWIKFTDDKGVLILDSANFKDQQALITPIRRR